MKSKKKRCCRCSINTSTNINYVHAKIKALEDKNVHQNSKSFKNAKMLGMMR